MTRLAMLAAASAALSLGACQSMDDGMDGMTDDMRTGASASASLPMVGGAAMYPNRTIVQNAMQSRDHTTLVSAVKAAGLAETLSGAGPFTVFAPTNAAFDRVAPATLQSLMEPANQAQLRSVLTYHVVPGNYSAAELMSLIAANPDRVATLTTANGQMLRATMEGNNVVIMGENGTKAYVTQADVRQSNGVIHVVNGVVVPRMM